MWQIRVYAGLDPVTGKRIELYETAPTEAEARAARKKLLAQVAAGRAPKARATVADAMTAWMQRIDVEASTRPGYQGYIDRTLKPQLGKLDVARLSVRMVLCRAAALS